MAIWNILWPFGNLLEVWYIFPRFGISNKEKSGNPVNVSKNISRPNLASNQNEMSRIFFDSTARRGCQMVYF
jgi:hypothetical protein